MMLLTDGRAVLEVVPAVGPEPAFEDVVCV
jgi:hypothetical protein